jgi:hypothetical protein
MEDCIFFFNTKYIPFHDLVLDQKPSRNQYMPKMVRGPSLLALASRRTETAALQARLDQLGSLHCGTRHPRRGQRPAEPASGHQIELILIKEGVHINTSRTNTTLPHADTYHGSFGRPQDGEPPHSGG